MKNCLLLHEGHMGRQTQEDEGHVCTVYRIIQVPLLSLVKVIP